MTKGSLMKVESIAECCNTFDLHLAIISLENNCLVFWEWPFYTGFTVNAEWYNKSIRWLVNDDKYLTDAGSPQSKNSNSTIYPKFPKALRHEETQKLADLCLSHDNITWIPNKSQGSILPTSHNIHSPRRFSIFSSYVGSGPASNIYPKKNIGNFKHPKKYLKF